MRIKILLSLFLTVVANICLAQVSSLQLPAPIDHYKELLSFSAAPNQDRVWMDTIRFPAEEYGNSLLFVLVKPHYLSEKELHAISENITFPTNSSDQTRKELDYLLQLQNKRTADEINRVNYLADIGYWPQINLLTSHPNYEQNLLDLFFEGREVLGKQITAASFPQISKLMQGVTKDMRVMEFTIKYKLLRPRPYHLEPKLKPLARIGSPSFPSGHTLWAFIHAFVWSEIVPQKRDQFIKLAEEIRRSREIMGIHYPSDNEASREIAFKMLKQFDKNPIFRKDLKEAIKEWNAKGIPLLRSNPANTQ